MDTGIEFNVNITHYEIIINFDLYLLPATNNTAWENPPSFVIAFTFSSSTQLATEMARMEEEDAPSRGNTRLYIVSLLIINE